MGGTSTLKQRLRLLCLVTHFHSIISTRHVFLDLQKNQITDEIGSKNGIVEIHEGLFDIVSTWECGSHIAFGTMLREDLIPMLLVQFDP